MERVYNQEFNYSNSVFRSIITALIEDLRNRVYIYQTLDNNKKEKIEVPFYYSVTGQERFLQDEFVYGAEEDGKAIGDYERVPRGVLMLTSLAVEPNSQTNKFLESKFVKEIDGALRTFIVTAAYLPIKVEFSVKMVCSNVLEMFKISEAILSKLYAVNTFYIDLGILTVEGSYTIPPSFSNNKTEEFSLNEKKQFQIEFSMAVDTFMPVLESGLTLDEISALAAEKHDQESTEGIYMFRPNKYGEYELRPGGLIKDVGINIYTEGGKKTMYSNNSEVPKNIKDYSIKINGQDEPQNQGR